MSNVEFHILRRLEQKMKQVKDCISIFYKNIETQIMEDDLHPLSKIFGYKSAIMRDDNHKYIFEIFCPVEIVKANKKLRDKEKRIILPKSF